MNAKENFALQTADFSLEKNQDEGQELKRSQRKDRGAIRSWPGADHSWDQMESLISQRGAALRVDASAPAPGRPPVSSGG